MEDIILSLEPAFHRVERYILWKNRYTSLVAFVIGNGIFYAIARAGLRPFCAVMLVVLLFHILDCLKQRRSHRLANDDSQFCELTQLILRSYRYVCHTHEQLLTLKTENRVKYSLLIVGLCAFLALLGTKISGYYISYLVMLGLFTLPAVIYHKLIPKLLKRMAPLLEQFDRSMEFERRSLLDQDKLLVRLSPSSLQHDDDEDVRRLREKQSEFVNKNNELDASEDEQEDDIEERNLINNTKESSETMLHFRRQYDNEAAAVVPKSKQLSDSSFDMLSDSSSSIPDDEAARITELYSNISGPIDGRHRIKIKTEMKMPTRSNKQRPKLMDAQFFNQDRFSNDTPLTNSANQEPDLASFDFLNDYDENK